MENKKTNRNTRLIIVAIVLALVVLFLCIGGSTFARYISSKNMPANQATVAKWGYVVNANADDLFAKQYDNTAIATDTTAHPQVDVKASGNVVAPGTTGSLTFSVTGSAEVLAKLEVNLTVKSEVKLTTGTGESATVYSPVKWTLNDGTNDVVDGGTLADVKTELDKISTVIEAGSTSINHSYTLSWEWALTPDDDANATTNYQDTLLGYAAAGAGTYGDIEVSATDTDGNITVTDKSGESDVVYTAVIDVEFDLSIKVVQISNDER